MLVNEGKKMLKVSVFQIKLFSFVRVESIEHTVKASQSVTYIGPDPC